MEKDISRLQRQVLLTRVASVLIDGFGILAILLYFQPELTGIPEDQIHNYKGQMVWLILGILFMMFGAYGFLFSKRWQQRLLQIYRSELPVPMNLAIEVNDSSDSTDYYALLSSAPNKKDQTEKWRVQLWLGLSNVQKQLLEGKHPCQVYFDSRLNRPVIIRTDYGLLWSIGGSGAAQKLSNR